MTEPFPSYSDQPLPQPGNGWSVATLVLGVLTILVCWIPFVGLLGFFTALSGIGTGIAALVVGRRRQRGAMMAASGLALCVLGIVVAIVITVAVGRSLADDEADDGAAHGADHGADHEAPGTVTGQPR